jgi:hypothetical protein
MVCIYIIEYEFTILKKGAPDIYVGKNLYWDDYCLNCWSTTQLETLLTEENILPFYVTYDEYNHKHIWKIEMNRVE